MTVKVILLVLGDGLETEEFYLSNFPLKIMCRILIEIQQEYFP